MSQPKVYLVVLNYDSWKDTIECLESIFKLDYTNYKIILVDNNSTDDSIKRLKEWMDGEVAFDLHVNQLLKHLSTPAIEKPLRYSSGQKEDEKENRSPDVVFLSSDINLGYAGGNNLGIRYGLSQGDADYFWVLNNDTVVPPDCLTQLVKQFELLREKGYRPGILGSKLRFYDEPEMLQGVGAIFNKYTAKITQIGTFEIDKGQYDNNRAKVDFVIGASLFASREMVEEAGVMAEEYFLYNEEIDWCFRAQRKGFFVAYASDSIIYHKQGASTKNSVKSKKKNINAMFYQFRNIILFYRKFYPSLVFIPMSVVFLRILKFSFSVDKKFISLLYPVLTQKNFFLNNKGNNRIVKPNEIERQRLNE